MLLGKAFPQTNGSNDVGRLPCSAVGISVGNGWKYLYLSTRYSQNAEHYIRGDVGRFGMPCAQWAYLAEVESPTGETIVPFLFYWSIPDGHYVYWDIIHQAWFMGPYVLPTEDYYPAVVATAPLARHETIGHVEPPAQQLRLSEGQDVDMNSQGTGPLAQEVGDNQAVVPATSEASTSATQASNASYSVGQKRPWSETVDSPEADMSTAHASRASSNTLVDASPASASKALAEETDEETDVKVSGGDIYMTDEASEAEEELVTNIDDWIANYSTLEPTLDN